MNGIRTLGYLTLDTGPLETIEAAAAAGFNSVGIRITGRRIDDPFTKVIGNKQAIAAIRRRISDTGLLLSNISAYHFYSDVSDDHVKKVMDTVIELGSGVLVSNSYDPNEQAYVDKLGRYCELGASAGVRIAVEFMRYSAVKSIHDASRIINAIGAPNLGYLIDVLHLARSGGTPNDIRSVDPSSIIFAQLCDGKNLKDNLSDMQLRDEARNGRLYPGDGSLPLHEFLSALPIGTEIEYEVPRKDLRFLTYAERAKVAFSVFTTFLDDLPVRDT